MDQNKEYHDPDYPEAAVCVKEESPSLTDEGKINKIRTIIGREFSNELEIRENEVMLIEQRMSTSRRLLQRLRYVLVNRYYADQKLQISNTQIQDDIEAQKDPKARAEASRLLREEQRRIHPSVRKLLGKDEVDISEIFRTRGPRNNTRRDYSAMLKKRNYTISADATKTLRPEGSAPQGSHSIQGSHSSQGSAPPKKVPRHLDPKITNVVTLDEATRNKSKHRYRLIIGNTSKYVPAASHLDRSTHKWLLYIREHPVLTSVTVTLHHSYCPHNIVQLSKPPYHVSRRGWGEFPARIQLHFTLPELNRPVTITHHVKLDRNRTGLQVLGSETVIDVWLYSNQEMIQHEYKDNDQVQRIEQETTKIETPTEQDKLLLPDITGDKLDDSWLDFLTNEPTELNVDEMLIKPQKIKEEPVTEIKQEIEEPMQDVEVPTEILNQPKKRIMKYIDLATGKIYYLEIGKDIDASKVQEIIINNTATKITPVKTNGLRSYRKKKESLLKPDKITKNKVSNDRNHVLSHIENDHCYLGSPKGEEMREIKKEKTLYDKLCSVMGRFCSITAAVNYLAKHIPLISDEARDPEFLKHFPFVVDSYEKYWKLDFAKRRNIEWSRAKLIQHILMEYYRPSDPVWRTKQILLYTRLHGHHPVRSDGARPATTDGPGQKETIEWSSWNEIENLHRLESSIKQCYPNASDIDTLTAFNFDGDVANDVQPLTDDEDVDVVTDVKVEVKKEVCEDRCLQVLIHDDSDTRQMYLYVERVCADIGLELRNEDIGHGYSYSAVHAVVVSAVRSFADELIRSALAVKRTAEIPRGTVWTGYSSSPTTISACDVYAATNAARLRMLSARDMAARRHTTHAV